jgi:hypothetical protein
MIQHYLNEVQEACNLPKDQLEVVRRVRVSYAADALMDSSIADQVFNISISEGDQEESE